MKNFTDTIILIADAHLQTPEEEARFFALLDAVAALPNENAIVFLGDIFELWIALTRYELPVHRRFLDWCLAQKAAGRDVLFVEGNHEFYISAARRRFFTFASEKQIDYAGLRFAHGDLINHADWKYALLRLGIRNAFTRVLLRLFRNWFGPALTQKIRLGLKTTNLKNKCRFPEEQVESYLSRESSRGVTVEIIGHFHERLTRQNAAKKITLEVLPAYLVSGEIGLWHRDSGTLETGIPSELGIEIKKEQKES